MPDSNETKNTEINMGSESQRAPVYTTMNSDVVPVPHPHKLRRFLKRTSFVFVILLMVAAGLYYKYSYKKQGVPNTDKNQVATPPPAPKAVTSELPKDKVDQLEKLDSSGTLGFTKIVSYSTVDKSTLPKEFEIFILADQKNYKVSKTVYENKALGTYISYIAQGQTESQVSEAFKQKLGTELVGVNKQDAGYMIEAKGGTWKAKILYFSSNKRDTIVSVEILPL